MKIAYTATLTEDAPLTGNGVLALNNVTKNQGPVLNVANGYAAKIVADGPVSINVSVGTRDAALVDVALLKNGNTFRYLAKAVSEMTATVVDAEAAKGDEYSVAIGLLDSNPVAINSDSIYTNLSVAG